MVRHEELAREGIPYLQRAPSALTIYPQYYMRFIGRLLHETERQVMGATGYFWVEILGDQEGTHYPRGLADAYSKYFCLPLFKQSAINFLRIVVHRPRPGLTLLC